MRSILKEGLIPYRYADLVIGAILPISLSGMTGAGRRIAASADDIANVASVDPTTGVAPVVRKVIATPVEPTGGVDTRYEDPRGPATILTGELSGAEIDLNEEVVSQQIAAYDFKANAKVLKTADAMERSLLDILA